MISLCLAAGLLAVSLWGCSPSGRPEGNSGAGRGETGSSQEAGGQESRGGAADGPAGRYVESSIPIPVKEGEKVTAVIRNKDKNLEAYTIQDTRAKRYVLTAGEWKKQDDDILEGLEFPYGIFHVIEGEDGNRYVLYPKNEGYGFCMLKLSEGQKPQPLLEDVFSAKNENGYYDSPDFAAVSADGNILLSIKGETRVYSSKGELLFSMPQQWSSSEWKDSGFLSGDQYLTIGEKSFLSYDISRQSAAPAAEFPYQSSEYDMFSPLAPDGSGGIYLVNAQGIHHMSQGGSLWETVADGSLNSLGLPSAYIRKMFVGDENDFYVWMSQSGMDEIKHYTYDPEMPSVPSQRLTVYGLDLENLKTIRQAAAMFQLKHPEVRVELIDGQAGAGSTTLSDTIRSLNTELLGGNGADILVLDGLPADVYIEKGVLEDMRSLLEPMIASGELPERIWKPYATDGGICQIPARMILLAAYGDPAAIDSLASLEAMREYQKSPDHLPLRPKTKYENLLRQVFSLRYEEIVDREDGRLVPGKMQELLETVRVLGEACGAKVSFDESEDGGRGFVYNTTPGMDGLIGSEYERVDRGRCAAAIEKIGGMYDTILPLAVQEKNGYQMANVNASYLPSGMVGINQASQEKELAREFILYLLGQEVQDADLGDGLPVNAKSVEAWIDREDSNSSSISVSSGSDDYMISGEWPDREDRRKVFEVAARADHPIRIDRVLMEIIINETKGYFEGSLSLEQAAQNAQNKADLYASE